MSSPPTGLQSLETEDPIETPQNSISSVDTTPQPEVNTEQNAQKLSLPRPILIYTRHQLVSLSKSPLVQAPPDMPDLKNWFGAEIENQVKKDELSTPGNARERRFRRDAEDGETHPRPTFRSTLTQPSQMGNFKHQSLRANDRDRERDRERDGEKDRERDIRDKEGQERLRHLSDKYDRDRLAQPPPSARVKDRDTPAHLNVNSTRGSQVLNANAAARRTETREAGKKKVGEASEDWRRGAEPPRSAREDRSDNGRKDREDRDARSGVRDTSSSKRDTSASRRDREKDHDETREKGRRGDRDDHRREKEEPRRDRDVDTEDDARRWKDDGRREERLATRRAERERARDKPAQDHALEATTDRRWTPGDDRDGRYKRSTARERKSGHLGDEGKEKEDRKDREREKEKEPAWMDTYIPTESSPGILGGQMPGGELDGIQAWKKGLKDKEIRDHETSSPNGQGNTLGQPSSLTLLEPAEKAMDEIQLFKLMMKREEEKKKSEDNEHLVSNGTSLPVLLEDDDFPQHSQQRLRKMLEESSSNTISGFTNGEHPQNVPVSTSIVDPSPVPAGSSPAILPLALKDGISQSNSNFDNLQDRNPPFPLKTFTVSTETSLVNSEKQPADFTAAQSFHPPTGSRLLAFARMQPKAVPNVNQATTMQTLNGQNVQQESQGYSKNEPPRPVAAFSPFEEQSRQAYGSDESRDSGIAANLMNLSLRGPVDQMFNPSNNQPEAVYNGFATAKGSRFAKFFDGKGRDGQPQSNKPQVPVGYISPSPNHHQRQEQSNLASNPGDQRTMDDIFAMLNSSSQRGNIAHHPVTGQLLSNNGFGAQGPNLHILQQQHHLQQQQQQHGNSRLESLYESRADDRSFVPDGMVPGLRPIPPPPARGRDNLGYFPEQLEDGLHYNLQRMTQQQQQTRSLESLYSGPTPPIYGQQGRHAGIPLQPLQQPQYRGGPSPNLTQQTTMSNNGQQQQRLPPGLANLGGRPPHEPAPFQGLSALPSINPHNNLHGNSPLPQMQQPSFNNFNVGNNLAFNARGPMPGSHVQNSVPQHTLGNIGHPNMDPRLSNHHLMGLGGSGAGGTRMNGGFSHQGPTAPSHLLMRPQQQQQPHTHQHMLPHLIPPHLQPQGHPGPNNQPSDLMALLMGGPHRE
ncbi:hypothetical protein BYT27DRAFT_7233070 [Phlegmacium glaucopus]|nr:hypothetical protein BYT27DRAFT_7233070 [Phlegmacium glaucopus]